MTAELNARLRASGICTYCRKAPAREGHAYCEACRQRVNKWHREHSEDLSRKKREEYLWLKERHVCVRCRRRRAVIGVRCEVCAERK